MLEIVVGGRQVGKTTAAVEWHKADPANRMLVVTTNERRLQILENFALKSVTNIVTFDDFSQMSVPLHVEVGYDDVEHMLTYLTGRHTGFISASGAVLVKNMDVRLA